jgi:hypothetical protein
MGCWTPLVSLDNRLPRTALKVTVLSDGSRLRPTSGLANRLVILKLVRRSAYSLKPTA